jgi:hypothetical protein
MAYFRMSLFSPQLVIKSVDKASPACCTLNAGRTAAFEEIANNDSSKMERIVEGKGDKVESKSTSCATALFSIVKSDCPIIFSSGII